MKTDVVNRDNITLYELWIGIGLWTVLIFATGIFWTGNKTVFTCSLLLGAVTAMVIAGNMASSIRRLLNSGSNGSNKSLQISSILRYVIVGIVLVVACLSPYGDPIWTFVGTMTLKLSAYVHPIIRKITRKVLKWNDDPTDEALEGARKQRELEAKERAEREAAGIREEDDDYTKLKKQSSKLSFLMKKKKKK